jgi:DNA-binding transcriptional LysR family regulator
MSGQNAIYSGAVRGRVRISIWYHFDPNLPELLRQLLSEYPGVQFSIAELTAFEMMDGLRRGDLDIACPLRTARRATRPRGLSTRRSATHMSKQA